MAQTSKVEGVVQIDGTPAERTVRAFGYGPTAHLINGEPVNLSKSLGSATSDPDTGAYTIDLLGGYGSEIFVVAFDDYGDAFTAEQALTAGDRIHPTTPNEHVWETTGAGTLPAEEPAWVVDTETAQLYGSASMIAKPFYRPMVQGPILPLASDLAELWTPAQTGTTVWFDLDDIEGYTVDAAGGITLVTDKSGNGHDLAQDTLADRPTLRQENEKVLMSSEAGTRSVSTTENIRAKGPVSVSVAMITDPHGGGGNYEMLWQIGDFFNHSVARYNRSDRQFLTAYMNGVNATPGTEFLTYSNAGIPLHVLTVILDPSVAQSHHINGVEISSSSEVFDGDAVDEILTLFDGSGLSSAKPFHGAIGEFLIEPVALDAESRQIREGYLAHKWGIAADLPDEHPYKDDPPVIAVETGPSPSTSYSSVILADNPVTYITFDDETADDISGNNNHAALIGNPITGNVSLVGGDNKLSVTLTGSEFIDLSVLAGTLSVQYTIEAWIKTTNGSTGEYGLALFSAHSSSYSNILRLVHNNDHLSLIKENGAEYDGAIIINDSQPHHIALVASGTDITVYIDGQADIALSESIVLDSAAYISVGQEYDPSGPSDYFQGTIDEIAVYGSSLSPQAVADHYGARNLGAPV